jgi:hypothetical protein
LYIKIYFTIILTKHVFLKTYFKKKTKIIKAKLIPKTHLILEIIKPNLLNVALGLHPRGSRPSTGWRCAAGLGWCCGLGVVLPKHHVVLGLPAAKTQFYFGSYL